jgi:hypothetical protein
MWHARDRREIGTEFLTGEIKERQREIVVSRSVLETV